MNKRISFWAVLCIVLSLQSQNSIDALRYSLEDIQGTARFRSMSGAFGALGGDLSAISLNPAGSAIFQLNTASVSFQYMDNGQDASYFNQNTNSNHTSFDVNQAGGVYVSYNNDLSSPWKKFAIGVVYDKVGEFDNDLAITGTNPTNSLANYFLANAQGKRLDEISAFDDESLTDAYAIIGNLYGFEHQQAFLGYESFIIDPVEFSDENTAYVSNVAGGNYRQRYFNNTRGYNGKFGFNLAAEYGDFLSLGLNLNTHFLSFDRSVLMTENNANPESLIRRIEFQDNLFTRGSGFSFQLGAIVKATKSLRIGLNYASPTWYYLNDETTQSIATTREESGFIRDFEFNPRIVNFYPSYRLQSPGKLGASMAYIFGSKALISFDYSYKDYGNMRYSPGNDPFFSLQNRIISDTFAAASTYRVGGEYRIKQFSLRGGYRYEESPYKNSETFGDLEGYSFGLGFNFGSFKLDGSFNQSRRESNYQLFDTGLTDTALINNTFTDVILTLSFVM